ncbi:FAD-dependent monooxygenase [Kutzneria kofuensis]|uniref:2-polyprenyl-6-methoxyphenol hydroxylase-like FAD-dependent oxidoreductase n=1 Tax=Kutzneria kofuensis TaxID=103725 RepID=A0A7W9KEE1_9PSEU|nr:FAD-dependent monooxygenase [Kutzneria kofuensis]MBB5890314.1 2-polyprenyl-6-methoxyphenol hydroxylase-like FAD-dependent oxidoreductase [Kutzneria kofuensis]
MTKILVSGASIAGPTAAYWLNHHGFEVTVVEQAPALRDGGSAVDFRGEQMEILRKMGVLADVEARSTRMGDVTIVDNEGRFEARVPSAVMSGEVEILRGDLSHVLYEHTKDKVEYVFGDRITSLTEHAGGVDVTFAKGAPRTFDLVIGADGSHSGVRSLAFGPEQDFATDLGYYVAYFTVPNHLGLDHEGQMYAEPGIGAMVTSAIDKDRLGVALYFASEPLAYDRHDIEQQKQILVSRFRDAGWELPTLLDGLMKTDTLFFDSLTQIRLDKWSRGRVVLVGDAAWAGGPGSGGTGLGMIGAYVLAGELATKSSYDEAFAAYEEIIRPTAKMGQNQAKRTGGFFAPESERGIRNRKYVYRVLNTKPMNGLLTWLVNRSADSIELPDYTRAA